MNLKLYINLIKDIFVAYVCTFVFIWQFRLTMELKVCCNLPGVDPTCGFIANKFDSSVYCGLCAILNMILCARETEQFGIIIIIKN